MALRVAVPADAPSIAQVHVRSWRQTYAGLLPEDELEVLDVDERSRFWEEVLSRQGPRRTLVAEIGGEVVGFASGGPEREEDVADEGEVYAIYLLEAYQGRGLGRRLFEAVLEHLRSVELVPVGLWVLSANPAVDFYEHLGGRRVDEREEEHGLAEARFRWTEGRIESRQEP